MASTTASLSLSCSHVSTPGAVESKGCQSPSSSLHELLNINGPGALALSFGASVSKAVRAYEVERQRAKKTLEQELAKERKEAAATAKGRARAEQDSQRAKEKGRPARKNVANLFERGDSDEATPAKAKARPELLPGSGVLASKRREVSLEDLVKTGGSKRLGKSRKRDADFELVPHIRAVIALDDELDLELDEAWEHVNAEDEATQPKASYAAVAAQA